MAKRINIRYKGAAGEREMCEVLSGILSLGHKLERNLDQVRNGGTDIIYPPFGVEVKRCQSLALIDWWIQAKHDAEIFNNGIEDHGHQITPVVAFRQNGKPWEFLISATYIGCELGFLRVSRKVFGEWAIKQYEEYTL